MVKEIKKFVNDLKVRTIFPFYIDNINDNFFSSINKYNNKSFNRKIASRLNNLKIEELKKLKEIEDISSHNTLLLLINRIIKKIVSKTGTDKYDLFVEKDIDKNNQPIYVEEKNEIYDFNVIGNVQKDRRYIYAIDIDKRSYLFNYVEQIQFSFYLDEKNKMVSGGVSWNWGNDNKPTNQEDVNEKVYITNLIKYYLTREIKDISLNNIISIFDNDTNNNQNKKRKFVTKQNYEKNITLESLRNSWKELITKKILNKSNYSEKLGKYLLNELFYSLMNTLMISLAVFEELKIYFRHNEPEIYGPLLKRVLTTNDNDNQNYTEDFFELFAFLKKNYFNFEKMNLKKILDADDAIQALIKFDKIENLYFGEPLLSYEIIRNSDIPFLDEDDDVFMNSVELKTLFLMTMDPQIFGIHHNNHNFINYSELNTMLSNINYNLENWKDVLNEKIDQTICEWNYDYVSFLNQDLTFLIVKNNNPIDFISTKKNNYDYDANRKLFNNYLWSQIYAHAIIYKMKDLELKFNTNKVKYPQLLRGYILQVEQLHFDWYDDFYGLPQIKKVIKKIDEFKQLNKSISLLTKKINREDKIYGKSKERLNISFAFIAASLFGITDFLTMVFTVLTVKDTTKGLLLENIITIAAGCFISFIMLLILLFSIISPIIKKRKMKKEV
ncbi:MPN338 family protein [Malacoplasma muris]|uniref:MPN338 family protein n=1 Tax=Malacoplasma muris TaxID=2119 RepID=UPI00398F0C21